MIRSSRSYVVFALFFITAPALAQPKWLEGKYDAHRDIEYAKVESKQGEMSLKLDVYVPKDVKKDAKLPCVVWSDGGDGGEGSKNNAQICGLVAQG